MHIYSYFLVVSLALNGLYISPALYTYILKYNLSILYNAAYIYVFKADCHWIDCSWCALLWGRLLKCPRWRMIYYLDWDSSKDLQNPPEAISISLVYTAAGDRVDVPGPCYHQRPYWCLWPCWCCDPCCHQGPYRFLWSILSLEPRRCLRSVLLPETMWSL